MAWVVWVAWVSWQACMPACQAGRHAAPVWHAGEGESVVCYVALQWMLGSQPHMVSLIVPGQAGLVSPFCGAQSWSVRTLAWPVPGHHHRNAGLTRPVGLTVPRAKLTFRQWVGAAKFAVLTYPLHCTQSENNEWLAISQCGQKSVRSELLSQQHIRQCYGGTLYKLFGN